MSKGFDFIYFQKRGDLYAALCTISDLNIIIARLYYLYTIVYYSCDAVTYVLS